MEEDSLPIPEDASELDEFAFKDSTAYKRSKIIKDSIRGNEKFNLFGDYRNRNVANNLIDLYTEYDSFVLENKLNFKEQELLLSFVNSEVMNVSAELGNLQSKPDVDLSSEEIEKLDDILDKAKKDFKGKLEIELSSIKGVPDNISELTDTPTNVVDDVTSYIEDYEDLVKMQKNLEKNVVGELPVEQVATMYDEALMDRGNISLEDFHNNYPKELGEISRYDNKIFNKEFITFDDYYNNFGNGYQLKEGVTPEQFRKSLENFINEIDNNVLRDGIREKFIKYDTFANGLSDTTIKSKVLTLVNGDVFNDIIAFNENLYTQEVNEDIATAFLGYEEATPVEDAYWAEVEDWELDAEGNPIRPETPDTKTYEGKLNKYYDLAIEDNKYMNNHLDTPTNVVDNKLSTFDTTLNSADGNVEFYIKHQGTQVSANDIRYNPNLGSDTEKFIPGFYGEPVGDVSAKTMGIKIQDNPVSNYYKVQVNTNNLLITQPDGFLGNQIDKVDWNIFAKETGISLSDIKNPKTQNVNSLINELKQLGLDDGIIAEGFRKSGIEGFVELKGDWREVVLIDPNDDLGIGSKLNIEDATEVEFLNNQSKVNQIDELVIKPTNVVDDIPPNQTLRVMEESGLSSHSERIRKVAQDYHKIAGLSDPEFKPAMIFSDEIGITSADIFDQLPMYDDTAIPYYNKFIRETNMQYETLIDSGMQFELTDTDPYTPNRAGHAQMINDMENGVLKVLSTESGFGNELTNSANPMLVQSKYTDINGRVMLENDVFRAVHDTFGHGMRGNTFGPVGEYNAWLAHKEMYSSDAKRVMTTETLGQNTYTNYGQHMRDANGNLLSKGDPNYLKPADRPYATQKVALMPQEIIETAGKVVEDVSELVDPKALNKVVEAANANPGVVDNIFKTSKKIVGKMFSTVGAIADPGDIAITQGIARLLPRLGVGVIAAPALAAYVGYELTVLLVDAANAVNKAAQNQNFGYGSQYTPSFMGGKTLQGTEPESVDVNWKKFGQDVWTEFGEVSDTWSLSWKISEPIIDYAFKEYAKYKNNSGNMNTGYIGSFNR